MTHNKTLTRSLMSGALGMGLVLMSIPTAHAEKVTSGSKYDINVAVFQGSCDPKSGFADNFASSILAAGKAKSGSFLDKFGNALNSAAFAQKGCTKTGIYVLKKSQGSMKISAGQWIVASKDGGNPFPAICQIPKGKTVTLKTRKSETLRSTFGFAGDAGLMCDFN